MGSGRSSHVAAVVGRQLSQRLPDTKVLLVGAGGIGCELLKNIVLTGFGHITLLDLDTIDLSNLNRQFLFRKKDVKQSKAFIAARTASSFNPSVHITPIHANIKDPEFDIAWFRQFDIVLNALDNLDARRHVNKMCLAASVPLVESGTAGYLGQVQPILKGLTECFDCMPKPTPKTFPVCTIRSTPSQPIHCIVWAKSYLIPQLFGEDENESAATELDEAEKAGENAQEIAALRKEAQAFTRVRTALRGRQHTNGTTESVGDEDPAKIAFGKVFTSDIHNLLKMSDMWRNRVPPVPLDFDGIRSGAFHMHNNSPNNSNLNESANVASGSGSGLGAHANASTIANGVADINMNGKGGQITNGAVEAQNSSNSAKLKDQKQLTIGECLELFVESTHRLASRLRAGEDTISFDKDDPDTLDFVTASANLRAFIYGIPGKSRWEVKEMAGNIIPAIATTNAVIAGAIVLQALRLLSKEYNKMRNVYLQVKQENPLSGSIVGGPAEGCAVCGADYTEVLIKPESTGGNATLRDVVEGILGDGNGKGLGGTGPRDVSVYEGSRILADPDFDDNWERTLESLGVGRGKFLTIVDEDGVWGEISIGMGVIPNATSDSPNLILPSPLPVPKRKKIRKSTGGTKRSADDAELDANGDLDDDIIIESSAPTSKKAKMNGNENSKGKGNGRAFPTVNMSSPSKKRRLEDEGLLMLEHPDENVDDEPELIEIAD